MNDLVKVEKTNEDKEDDRMKILLDRIEYLVRELTISEERRSDLERRIRHLSISQGGHRSHHNNSNGQGKKSHTI